MHENANFRMKYAEISMILIYSKKINLSYESVSQFKHKNSVPMRTHLDVELLMKTELKKLKEETEWKSWRKAYCLPKRFNGKHQIDKKKPQPTKWLKQT